MWLGGPEALDFFQSVQKANYHFADVNSARNFIINQAENMFNNTRRAIQSTYPKQKYLKILMKDGSLICWKISKSMMKL
jgi:hypothetical protein